MPKKTHFKFHKPVNNNRYGKSDYAYV